MQNNQLESLESVAYSKLAEFIQTERLQEASYLVDIISRIKGEDKYLGRGFLAGSVDSSRILFKDKPLSPLLSDYTTYPTLKTTEQFGGYGASSIVQNKTPEYRWGDGSKDPREDYWRDG